MLRRSDEGCLSSHQLQMPICRCAAPLRLMSSWGHSRRLRHVRLRFGLGTISDIFADDCRTNLSRPKVNLAHPAGLAYRLPDISRRSQQ